MRITLEIAGNTFRSRAHQSLISITPKVPGLVRSSAYITFNIDSPRGEES